MCVLTIHAQLKSTVCKINPLSPSINPSSPPVFQKHYTDCNFSLTGHQIVIVTAGAGIFEVSVCTSYITTLTPPHPHRLITS